MLSEGVLCLENFESVEGVVAWFRMMLLVGGPLKGLVFTGSYSRKLIPIVEEYASLTSEKLFAEVEECKALTLEKLFIIVEECKALTLEAVHNS